MDAADLRGGYLEWLGRYRWQWFASLTFRGCPPLSKANDKFLTWIGEINQGAGTRRFCWFRVTEYGASKNNLHFHALLGGLGDATKWPWLFRWDELAGEAEIFYFTRGGGAIQYLLKTLRPNCDFECEFELP